MCPEGRSASSYWWKMGTSDEATSHLKHKNSVGKVCLAWQGRSFGKVWLYYDTADCQQKRKMVTNEFQSKEEEERKLKAEGMVSQWTFMKWLMSAQ